MRGTPVADHSCMRAAYAAQQIAALRQETTCALALSAKQEKT
jgi:hypothetical protein